MTSAQLPHIEHDGRQLRGEVPDTNQSSRDIYFTHTSTLARSAGALHNQIQVLHVSSADKALVI